MVTVVKANGAKELFSEAKLLQSIQRAGVPIDLQDAVLTHVRGVLFENITTYEIYRHINDYLAKSQEPFAKSRYTLKEAITLLGPTGYPFEDYLAQILEERGYQVKTRQVMRGRCISHEVDIIARKDGKTTMIEAKFHNNTKARTEVHVPMYTKSRFDDVKEKYSFDEAMIVTNTKATIDAIAFAECSGMKIFSWSYPEEGSLRDVIEEFHLFPVTALMSLRQTQKIKLLQNHIVLCKKICADHALLDILRLDREQKKQVLDEITFLCHRDLQEQPMPV